MGIPQDEFLRMFTNSFAQRFNTQIQWNGGQTLGNFAGLPGIAHLCREGKIRSSKRFEVGDISADVSGIAVVVEFDGDGVSISGSGPVSNLLKYWPYIKGHLSAQPELPLVLCTFSNWYSYGSYRDLWNWLLERTQADQARIVDIQGCQFDHGGKDLVRRTNSIQQSLDRLSEQGLQG